LRWKEEASGIEAWRRPRPRPRMGDSTELRQNDEASGIRVGRSEEVGGIGLRRDWGWGRAHAVGSSEWQCMAVAACASEWARACVSGPVWEYFSCKNSLTFGSPSIFGGPG
jgi:hypothetical protein